MSRIQPFAARVRQSQEAIAYNQAVFGYVNERRKDQLKAKPLSLWSSLKQRCAAFWIFLKEFFNGLR